MKIDDFCQPGSRFVVETVCGPYVCEWARIDGKAAIKFIARFAPPATENSPVPTSPIPLQPSTMVHEPFLVEEGGIPLQ